VWEIRGRNSGRTRGQDKRSGTRPQLVACLHMGFRGTPPILVRAAKRLSLASYAVLLRAVSVGVRPIALGYPVAGW
jgi:hypothetical protein